MGEIIFKTELIKGAKGDRGEAGQADSIPTDGVIAFQGETVPDGYEETDPGDVFDEVYEDINAVKDMISDEYDTTATYNAGNYCIHENALYKCTATTTGLWDSSKWVLTSASDETKANAAAISAMENVTGACNLAINEATTKTDSGVLFTVNADKSVTVQRQSPTTDPYSYIRLFDNKTLPATPLILSGCPNVTGLTLYLYDKTTSTRYNQTGDDIEVTPDASHTYSLVIEALNSADLDTAVTVYPMLYDARLTPTGYVSPAMTNRELTDAVTNDEEVTFNTSYLTSNHIKITKRGKQLYLTGYFRCNEIPVNETFIWITDESIASINGHQYNIILGTDNSAHLYDIEPNSRQFTMANQPLPAETYSIMGTILLQ